jgi:hypothetical protein
MEYDPTILRIKGWENKPVELDTRTQWTRHNRKVSKGEKPIAILLYEVTRKKFVGDGSERKANETVVILREIPLYAFEQTRKFHPTARTLAIRALATTFLRYSNRYHYIWHNDGGWITCSGKLPLDRFEEHLRQREIYGVRSNGRWTYFGGIDLDLHHGDHDIFLDQLNILLDEFHGRDGWHFQVADELAKGVHLLQVLLDSVDYHLYRKNLRLKLEALDNKYPELAMRAKRAGMKSLKELEIFPNVNNGLRLPFCRGRSLLLDGPLEKIKYRKQYAVDVERYIDWINNPTKYMPRSDVTSYISERLIPRFPIQVSNKICVSEQVINSNAVMSENNNKRSNVMKGRFALDIQTFWTGINTPPDTLNRAILLIANIAPHYYSESLNAISAIEALIDDLPDIGFSDRLSSGNRADVSRVVVHAVSKAFQSYQTATESNAKLTATFQAWTEKGFHPFDKSTWGDISGSMKLGADFDWTDAEKTVLSATQNILKTDAINTAHFLKYLIRIIAGHDGEIAITFVEQLMVKNGIKKGSHRDRKANALMKLLLEKGLIVLLSESRWHPRQTDKSQSRGIARRYGIGAALKNKFVNDNYLYKEERENMYLLLQHHLELSEQDRQELMLEYSRLKARISDVQELSDEDRNELTNFLNSNLTPIK